MGADGKTDLTVAVTGPTGTFGFGLIPLLQADDRVARVIGIARRPFDPARYGWTKMRYHRGDVRDPGALEDAFTGADVVVHLAFLVTGAAPRETIRAVNVEGTLNAFRATAQVCARRFVYAPAVAAYGFHPDNPVGMTEDWPVRPAARLFYAKEKAELEWLLQPMAARSASPALYLLRPSIVVGPHTVGAKNPLPARLATAGRLLGRQMRRPPVPVPVFVPDLPVRMLPVPLPAGPAQAAARTLAALPFLPPVAQRVETASHPAIMDTTRAKQRLGWVPRFTAADALRAALHPGP